MAATEFTIGVLSDQTGVNIETIRYYERIGLIESPPRSSGGRRLYDGAAARRLQFVRRSRELGFTIDDIRALLNAADGGASCAEVHDLTRRHLNDVRAKIEDLQSLERTLARTARKCARDGSNECPIIDVLAEA